MSINEPDRSPAPENSPRVRTQILLTGLTVIACVAAIIAAYTSSLTPQMLKEPMANDAVENGSEENSRRDLTASESHSLPETPTIRFPNQPLPAAAERLDQQTREIAKRLTSSFPKKPAALHVAAMMHAQLRETSEAKNYWSQCIELAPNDARYTLNFATVAMEQGDNQQAAKLLGELMRSGNESVDILLHYGMALTNSGEAEKGRDVLMQGIAKYPEAASLKVVLGQAHLKLNELQQAIEAFEQAIQADVDSSDVYFNLMTAHRRAGNSEEAEKYQTKFDAAKQDSGGMGQQRFQTLSVAEARRTAVTILVEASSVYLSENKFTETEQCLLQALALEPTTLAAYQMLADMYQATGQLANEQAARQRLLDLEPFRFEHLLTLAQVSAEMKQLERAEGYLKLALAQNPDTLIARVALAEFYLDAGKFEQACHYGREAVERFPSAEGFEFLAKAYNRAGNSKGEAEATANAIRLRTSGKRP